MTGATIQPEGPDPTRLPHQAYELIAALLAQRGALREERPDPGSSPHPQAGSLPSVLLGNDIHQLGELVDPLIRASVPVPPPDMELVRRQAHEFIESLLVTFSQATGEKAAPYEDQVPLIQCAAPVLAGGEGSAMMAVSNEEDTPADVSLYCTNFIGDSGYEIPSLRVAISPRTANVPAKGDANFEIKISVPQQAPAGTYSGLIQAMGSKYVKAVLSVEVL